MSYPGSPEIPSDIQQRLLDAFGEALDLAEMGKREEASLGCDFILRTDPQFEPARLLMRRVQQATGPISVDDLRDGSDVASGRAMSGMPAPDGGFEDPGGDLRQRILALLSRRQLEDAVNLGMEHAAEIAEDSDLLHRLQEAQTRLEAAPYILQFLESARAAAANADLLERDRWLGKIRALDPENPALAEFFDAAPTVSTTGLFQPVGGFDFAPVVPPDDFPEPALSPPTREASLARFAQALENEESVSPSGAVAESGNVPVFSRPLEISGIGRSLDELAGYGPASRPAGAPAVAAGGEDDRIQALLAEGQAAFERGELQSAIDAWSRIFLIDIDHAEANRRIEEARRVKAEADRRIEEMFHEGVAKFEAGDSDGARSVMERLLQHQPGYLAARELITQIDSGSGVVLPRLGEAGAAAETKAARGGSEQPLHRERASRSGGGAVESGPKKVPKKGGIGGIVRIVGVAALVGVGGWLAWSNRASWLPGSSTPATARPIVAVDPIERAKRLHAEGKTSSALQVLKRIAPGSVEAEVARALIGEWEALEAPKPAGPSPETLRQQGELLAAAQSAAAANRFREAHRLYEQASALLPLPASSVEAAQLARARVEVLAPQLAMFKDGSWEEALPTLWRLHEASPADHDVSDLMVIAYSNLAIRELQQESPLEALPNLKEALTIVPGDAQARRLLAFAESYREKEVDLQYRIYVKYLPFRS